MNNLFDQQRKDAKGEPLFSSSIPTYINDLSLKLDNLNQKLDRVLALLTDSEEEDK